MVAAQLDEAGTEHQAEEQPLIQHDDQPRRRCLSTPKKDRQKSCFQQHGLPAESVKGLSHVDVGKIDNPEKKPNRGRDPIAKAFRKTGQGEKRESDANPAEERRTQNPWGTRRRCLEIR